MTVEQWATRQGDGFVKQANQRQQREQCAREGQGVAQLQGRPELKRELKGLVVSQGISMTDLLKEGFALSKKKQQK